MTVKNNYPNVRPSIGVNFARSKKLDPKFNFTRTSSGTYIGSDGLIKTARVGEPRFDHDPATGESKGLLIESQSTNNIPNSSNSTTWSSSNCILTHNAEISPDGTNTALKVVPNASNSTHIINLNGGRCRSFYAKFAGSRYISLSYSLSNNFGATYDLLDGKIIAVGGHCAPEARITKLKNDWYRCSIITFCTFNDGFQIVIHNTGNFQNMNTSYIGDQINGVYIWGPQSENRFTFPESSYIPTTGSTSTRAADTLTVPSSILNPSKSSIRIETESQFNNTPAFSLNDGTAFSETKLLVYPTAGGSRLVTSDIVRNGLVLNLDAGNPASYPGSGTTWTDLSGNGNNGTLVNGVGYSGSNLGSLVFDGVDDRVGTSLNLNGYNIFSVGIWVYAPLTGQEEFILGTASGNGNERGIYISFYSFPSYLNNIRLACWNVGSNPHPYSVSTSNGIFNQGGWNYIYFEFNGTTTNSIHKIVVNNSYTQNITMQNNFSIHDKNLHLGGIIGNVTSGYGNNNIAQVSIYNRALTASEIQQNFNVFRGRFSI